MSDTIRVLLADGQRLFRAGVRALLEKVADVEVVGEAGTGLDALRLIEDQKPDVVLMNTQLPELNGFDTTVRIKEKLPQVRVIILAKEAAEDYVLHALRVGADGYLLKNVSPTELELAIRAVGRGEKFLDSAVSKQVIESYGTRGVQQGTSSLERLTSRQREVLQLVAESYSSKQIATKLELRVKTVEMHRSQLMAALDIHEVASLVRYAIRVGLISSDN